MSGANTGKWLEAILDKKSHTTQISIVWFQGEELLLDWQKVVDTIKLTESSVQNIIWMNGENITMDWIPVVNTLH